MSSNAWIKRLVLFSVLNLQIKTEYETHCYFMSLLAFVLSFMAWIAISNS